MNRNFTNVMCNQNRSLQMCLGFVVKIHIILDLFVCGSGYCETQSLQADSLGLKSLRRPAGEQKTKQAALVKLQMPSR